MCVCVCVCVNNYIWNPSAGTCENGKYLESIDVDVVITYDEIIGVGKLVPMKNFSNKNYLIKNCSNKF